MKKLFSVVSIVMLLATMVVAQLSQVNKISNKAVGSVTLQQSTYSVGVPIQIDYTYAGLPIAKNDVLLMQTICWGQWNGVVFDTSSQYLDSATITYSTTNGSGSHFVEVPSTYHGSGSCNVTLYLMFTVSNNRYAKSLSTASFSVH